MTNHLSGYVAATVLAGVGLLRAQSAQGKPDFSRTWILESTLTGPDVPQTLSVTQPLVTANVRGEPMPPTYLRITITRTFGSNPVTEVHHIGTMGGIVGGIPADVVRTVRTRVDWEEQALAFEREAYTGSAPETGDWTSKREVWSFDSDGRLRLVISTRGSAEAPRTTVLVYRRQ